MNTKKDQAKTGVMLVNLGSPESAEPGAVRRFLREFLSDPRVVEIPKWLWFFILNGIVLLVRPKKSAAAYQKVWSEEYGSPLIHYTKLQASELKAQLDVHVEGDVRVEAAMRYGQPSMASVMERFRNEGVDRVLLLPMYPQYSATTTATVFDEMGRLLSKQRNQPAVRTIKDYHDCEYYIDAMAKHIRQYWQANGKGDKLVLSFHGIPQRCVNKGDPYAEQCKHTGRLLADALLLSGDEWELTFQSRFGAEEWLQPYTSEVFEDLGEDGVERIDVFCPGFSSDCLETLEEIAIEGRKEFLEEGGKEFHYIPCLNAEPTHIDSLLHLLEDNLQGWETFIEEDSRNPIQKIFSKVAGR
jgi:ferrochelatase